MKKIIFRKLLSDYIIFFVIALFSSTIVVWIFQAVNFLDLVIEDSRDYLVYINYSLLNFPKILSKLFPFILFFSIFYVTDKYEQNNELMIFWNFGVNKTELINLVFKFSFILLLVQILFTSLIVPNSQNLARSFIKNSNISDFSHFIKPQKFNDTISGITIFSESKDDDGYLYNLYMKRELDNNDFLITYAEKGKFENYNNTPVLILFNGETLSNRKNEITNFSFSKTDFVFKDYKTNTTTQVKTQEISTNELVLCINQIYKIKIFKKNQKIINCSSGNIKNILKEIYKRLVIPFYIPLLILISLLLLLYSKEHSKYKQIKFLTFFLGLIIIIFSETTIRFVNSNIYFNLTLIIIPFILIFIFYCFFIFNVNTFGKKRS